MGCWYGRASGHTFTRASLTTDESTGGTHTHLRNSPQNGKAPNISRTPAEIQRYSACWLVKWNSRVLHPIHVRSSRAEKRRRTVVGCWEFTPRAWGKHAEPARANANQRVLACRILIARVKSLAMSQQVCRTEHAILLAMHLGKRPSSISSAIGKNQRTCARCNESPEVGRNIEERARHGLLAMPAASAGPTSLESKPCFCIRYRAHTWAIPRPARNCASVIHD